MLSCRSTVNSSRRQSARGLLAGTFRDQLLAEGKIKERVITVEELKNANEFFLINSVRKWIALSASGLSYRAGSLTRARRNSCNPLFHEATISCALSPRFTRSSVSAFTSKPQIAIHLPLIRIQLPQRERHFDPCEQRTKRRPICNDDVHAAALPRL